MGRVPAKWRCLHMERVLANNEVTMRPKRTTSKSLLRARQLRKEMGPAEIKLWAYLRSLREDGVNFRRQHAIGPYITDFCAPGKKLIVEVDGSQHLEQEEYDEERTRFLKSKGYRVLRFWNSDVMNKVSEVMGVILEAVEGEVMEVGYCGRAVRSRWNPTPALPIYSCKKSRK